MNTINNENRFTGLNQDLGLNYKNDSTKLEWDNKISLTYSQNTAAQFYNSMFSSPIVNIIDGNGDAVQKRKFFLAQSDLTLNLPLSIKME